MRILIVGSGAREDALSWGLARSPSCRALFAAPGNAGTALRCENWPEVGATDGRAIARRATAAKIDLVVLGPETTIAAGVGDRLRDAGFAVFGPSRAAGRLESSKIFAKRFLERHGIPTARGRVVRNLPNAERVLAEWQGGCVIKADGLAAGKGVVVTDGSESARGILTQWFTHGVPGGGNDILLEERLNGREMNVFAVGDGKSLMPFAAACDYKRAGEDDTGPNTGGMGAYSPPHDFPADFMETVTHGLLNPVARGLAADGEPYIGILSLGLMWTAEGPKVLEFDVRFGDPETQVIVPRIQGDFARLLQSAAYGRCDPAAARVVPGVHAVGVILATPEYPVRSAPLPGLRGDVGFPEGQVAFWGRSTRRDDACVDAAGGRVLTVMGTGDSLEVARTAAYDAVEILREQVGSGVSLSYRRDIALCP